MSSLQERLTDALRSVPGVADPTVEVHKGRGWSLTATVISRSFERQDEADRQQLVWETVLGRLPNDDAAQVEFIFTLTPDEARQLGLTG